MSDREQRHLFDASIDASAKNEIRPEHPSLVNEQAESTLVTEIDDEVDYEGVLKPTKRLVAITESKPSEASWLTYFFYLIVLLIAIDYLLALASGHWFWTERTLYVYSLLLRFVLGTAVAYWSAGKLLFRRELDGRLIHSLVGMIAGLILAGSRFAQTRSFWTFINMFLEPLNSLLLLLLGSAIAFTLHKKLNKQKYAHKKFV